MSVYMSGILAFYITTGSGEGVMDGMDGMEGVLVVITHQAIGEGLASRKISARCYNSKLMYVLRSH